LRPEASARRDGRSNVPRRVLELEAGGTTDHVAYFERKRRTLLSRERLRRDRLHGGNTPSTVVSRTSGSRWRPGLPMITTTINSRSGVKPLRSCQHFIVSGLNGSGTGGLPCDKKVRAVRHAKQCPIPCATVSYATSAFDECGRNASTAFWRRILANA